MANISSDQYPLITYMRATLNALAKATRQESNRYNVCTAEHQVECNARWLMSEGRVKESVELMQTMNEAAAGFVPEDRKD